MKKVVAFALVVALVVSLGLSVAADTGILSPAGTAEDLKPFLVSSTCDAAKIYSAEEIAEVSEEIQKIFADAKEKLPEAVPEGMAVRYFLYIDVCESCGNADIELRLGNYSEIAVKLFVDGEWVDIEFNRNANDTITIMNALDAPLAIFVK